MMGGDGGYLAVDYRVTGVDWDDPAVEGAMAARHPDTLLCGGPDHYTLAWVLPQEEATTVGVTASIVAQARAYTATLPGIRFHGLARDLVGTTDVAHRVGCTREGVRRWQADPTYPPPYAVLRAAGTLVWEWGDVLAWVAARRSIRLPDEGTVLTPLQVAAAEAALLAALPPYAP